jgi:hypothetical protein
MDATVAEPEPVAVEVKVVDVATPVVDASVTDDGGPVARRAGVHFGVDIDELTRQVVADARHFGRRTEVFDASAEQAADRFGAFVARLPDDLERRIRFEQLEQLLDPPAVDQVRVGGDRAPNALLHRHGSIPLVSVVVLDKPDGRLTD